MKNPFVFGRLKEEDPRREALETTIETVYDELEKMTADVDFTMERS